MFQAIPAPATPGTPFPLSTSQVGRWEAAWFYSRPSGLPWQTTGSQLPPALRTLAASSPTTLYYLQRQSRPIAKQPTPPPSHLRFAGQGFALAIAEANLFPEEQEVQTESATTGIPASPSDVAINSASDLVPLYGPSGELVINTGAFPDSYDFLLALKPTATSGDVARICNTLAGTASGNVAEFRGSCNAGLQAQILNAEIDSDSPLSWPFTSVTLNSEVGGGERLERRVKGAHVVVGDRKAVCPGIRGHIAV